MPKNTGQNARDAKKSEGKAEKPNGQNPKTPAEMQPHNAKKEGLGPNTKR